VVGDLQRPVDDRLVLDDPAGLDAARGGDQHLRAGVLDADRQLVRRETAEDHRVHRSDAGAGEHRDHGLGDHRQVDHHAVPGLHAETLQDAGERRGPLQQLRVAEGRPGAGDGAVVDQGRTVAVPVHDVPVQGVVAGVQRRVGEPPVERRVVVVEDAAGLLDPVDQLGLFAPVGLGVLDASGVLGLVVGHSHSPILLNGSRPGQWWSAQAAYRKTGCATTGAG
jgi:hypothetical protein